MPYDNEMFNVGAQLRKIRKQSNLTLDQLAASSGVDRGTISRIELGHVSPRIDTIGFLCEAMNTNVGTFFEQPELALQAEGPARRLPGSPSLADADPLADPAPASLGARLELPFVLETPVVPAMEGYWPVPSTFWKGLLEVLERFEILVKNSREMIMVKDNSGVILYTSPPCELMLGFRPQDLVGQKVQTLIHPDDLLRYQLCLASLAGLAGESRSLDYRMLHKDGSWCKISSKITNQLDNPSIRALVVNSLKIQELL